MKVAKLERLLDAAPIPYRLALDLRRRFDREAREHQWEETEDELLSDWVFEAPPKADLAWTTLRYDAALALLAAFRDDDWSEAPQSQIDHALRPFAARAGRAWDPTDVRDLADFDAEQLRELRAGAAALCDAAAWARSELAEARKRFGASRWREDFVDELLSELVFGE